MSKNTISALIVAAALLLWLGSGMLGNDEGPTEHATLGSIQHNGAPNAERKRVRVRDVRSEARMRFLVLRGRTQSKRAVDVKAEISGKVISRPVERGMHVAQGDLLCELAVDDRDVAVAEAKAAVADAQIEYQGSLKLKKQGLLSEIGIAGAEARLEAARAQLHRQRLNLERTKITAPFAGVLEALQMNAGDYAMPGATCATLIELDPMLISANVTEEEVEYLVPGGPIFGRTRVGRELEGNITFIGKQSDPITRTYPVEMTVSNTDYSIRSGLTVNVRIGLGEVQAHKVSPALFTLSDTGEVGVRIIDSSDTVVFQAIKILEDGVDGVWITGLPTTVRLITVGQEFVSDGEQVDAVFSDESGDQMAQP